MNRRVLCVDDEPNVLSGYQRVLRQHFEIKTAPGGPEALETLRSSDPFAVIVSDMRMPGMDGIQFLAIAREAAPDSIRMMLTGNADQKTAIEAVNEGNIFRFLNKPCPPETLAKALEAGINQFHLVQAEKELLEKTLKGSVEVLTSVLALVNPIAFGRASRVQRLASMLAEEVKAEDHWQIDIAALLSQIGCVTVPETTLSKIIAGGEPTLDEARILRSHPKIGHDLLVHIPRLAPVAEIIGEQERRFDGSGSHEGHRIGKEIPLGARILKLAIDYDTLIASGLDKSRSLTTIRGRRGWYDPALVEALVRRIESDHGLQVRLLRIDQLVPGTILDQDVVAANGTLLIARGQEVTESMHRRLGNFSRITGGIPEPIRVITPFGTIPECESHPEQPARAA